MKNLYIQTAFLGDLLLSVPTLRQIGYLDVKSSLVLVCRKGYGKFFERLGLCQEVIELDKNDRAATLARLRSESFNYIFCPHQSWSSHQMVRQLRAKIKIGYRRWWNSGYFDHRVERQRAWPEAVRQLQLLQPISESWQVKFDAFLQEPSQMPGWSSMRLAEMPWDADELSRLWQRNLVGCSPGSYICLAPGSVWETKRWPETKWIDLAKKLVHSGQSVVLLGAPEESQLCERIAQASAGTLSLAGRLSLLESLMVLSQSRGLVCNDSGAMHLGSLLHLPTVALFGPTVQQMGYRPWNPRASVIENRALLCRPCGQHGGRSCPIATHICMESLEVNQVIQTIRQWPVNRPY